MLLQKKIFIIKLKYWIDWLFLPIDVDNATNIPKTRLDGKKSLNDK